MPYTHRRFLNLLRRRPPAAEAVPPTQVRSRGALLGGRLPAGSAGCGGREGAARDSPVGRPCCQPRAQAAPPVAPHPCLTGGERGQRGRDGTCRAACGTRPPTRRASPAPLQATRTRNTSSWPPRTRRCSGGAWRYRAAPCCLPRSTACTWSSRRRCRSRRSRRWGRVRAPTVARWRLSACRALAAALPSSGSCWPSKPLTACIASSLVPLRPAGLA